MNRTETRYGNWWGDYYYPGYWATPCYPSGWICPKCGRVNAPWMSHCDCCSKTWTITSDTTPIKTATISTGNTNISTATTTTGGSSKITATSTSDCIRDTLRIFEQFREDDK